MTYPARLALATILILLTLALSAPTALSAGGAGEIVLRPEAPECVKRIAVYSHTRQMPLAYIIEQGSYVIQPSQVNELIEIAVEIDEQQCYMRGFRDEVRLLEYQGPRMMVNSANYTMSFTILVKRFKTVYVAVSSDPPYCISLVRGDTVRKEDERWLVGPFKVGDQPAYVWLELIPSGNCSFSSWSPSPLTSSNPHSTVVSGYLSENVTLVALFQPIAPQAIEGEVEGAAPPAVMFISLLKDNYPLLIILSIIIGAGVAIPRASRSIKRRRRVDWLTTTLQHLEREADAKAPWIGIFTKKIALKTFRLEELVEGLEIFETASEHHALAMLRPSSVASLYNHLASLLGISHAMVADKAVAGLCAYYGIAPFTRDFAAGARARVEEVVRSYRRGDISTLQAVNMLYEFLVEWASSSTTSKVHDAVSTAFRMRHGRLPKIPDWADDIMSLCTNMLRAPRAVVSKVDAAPRAIVETVESAVVPKAPSAPAKPLGIPEPLRRKLMEHAAANLFYNPFREDEELERLATRLCREAGVDIPVSEAKTLLRRAVYELRTKIIEGQVRDLDQLPIPREVLELEPDEITLYAEGCDPIKLYWAAADIASSTDPERAADEKVGEVVYEGVQLTDHLRRRVKAALLNIAERIKERGVISGPKMAVEAGEGPAEAIEEKYMPKRLEVKWVEEGEIGRLCPLCGGEISKSMEGRICYSCNVIYKIRRGPAAHVEGEEAWTLKIPEEVARDPGVKVVVLRGFPYNVPATFTIKCEGFEATVYREPAKRGMRAEDFMENLVRSIERDIQTGRCPIIVVSRLGVDPWSRRTIYLDRVIGLTSMLAHSPHFSKRLRLIIVVPEETIFLKDVVGELRRRFRELNIEFQEYVVELPYEEVLESAKRASIANPEQIAHLLRAFPGILRHLRHGKPLPEAVRIELAPEGEDVQYIIDAVEKFYKSGRRLREEEVKDVIGVGGMAWVRLQTLKALDLVG